jgi:hypothetical protein
MQRIIKNNQIVDETWHLLPKDFSFDELSNCDDYIVPLQMWRDHAHVLKAREHLRWDGNSRGVHVVMSNEKRKLINRRCSELQRRERPNSIYVESPGDELSPWPAAAGSRHGQNGRLLQARPVLRPDSQRERVRPAHALRLQR